MSSLALKTFLRIHGTPGEEFAGHPGVPEHADKPIGPWDAVPDELAEEARSRVSSWSERLYREAGCAIHMAQVLETSLLALISIANKHLGARIDDRLVLSDDRRPLGPLIRAVRGNVDPAG